MQLNCDDFNTTNTGLCSREARTYKVRHGGIDFAQLPPLLLGRVIAKSNYVISAHVAADGRCLEVVVVGPFHDSNVDGFVHWLVEELKTTPACGAVSEPHPAP